METIKLPETDYEEMKQFYQEEYDRALRRLQHIESILKKIDPETLSPGKSAGNGQEVVKAIKSVRKKKAGRKSKWEAMIMKRMRQLDKPVTYDELAGEIMTAAKLPENKRKSTKQAVVNVVFRLRTRTGKLDTFSVGTREKYIALKNWFEPGGEIKKEYAAKIELPSGKKPRAKSKRKRPVKKRPTQAKA